MDCERTRRKKKSVKDLYFGDQTCVADLLRNTYPLKARLGAISVAKIKKNIAVNEETGNKSKMLIQLIKHFNK